MDSFVLQSPDCEAANDERVGMIVIMMTTDLRTSIISHNQLVSATATEITQLYHNSSFLSSE